MVAGLFTDRIYGQALRRRSSSASNRAVGRTATVALAEGLERRLLLTTFVVTDPGDPVPVLLPPGLTLREAITASNLVGGSNTIRFDLPAGQTTIRPVTALPPVTTPTLIDGTSQPTYSGTPIVWLEAATLFAGGNGLTLSANDSTVRGLAITGFSAGAAVELDGANDLVDADYLGIDPAGGTAGGNPITSPEANRDGARANGTNDIVRNSVLSNNINAGVSITAYGTEVIGNLIGTDPSGEQARGNSFAGVFLSRGSNVTIGGTTAADRNIISGNFGDGVSVADSGSGDLIEGNYIGLDAAGTTPVPIAGTDSGNGGNGIFIEPSTPGPTALTIGGATPSAANVISGNQADGILVQDASGNSIDGNMIGTDPAGATAIQNHGDGVHLLGSSADNLIGGAGAARNVISGNHGDGITFETDSSTSGNTVAGNLVGTDVNGSTALPNEGNGITASDNITIGASGAGNTVSGNTDNGIELDGGGNVVVYNNIGVQATDPSTGLGNGVDGVRVLGSNNVVGTTTAGNNIGYNGANGVTVGLSRTDPAIQNSIRGDSIYYNGKLGIDLGNDGVTLNDPEDPDVGPNLLQNFPVLSSVTLSGNTATISGTLNSTPLSNFAIDFFASQIWDTTHYGEGQKYLGSITVMTDAVGNASFTATMPGVPSGFNYFAATATDSHGNTSEFAYDPVAGSQHAFLRHRHSLSDEVLRDAAGNSKKA